MSKKIISLLIFVLLGAGLGIYSNDLIQRNPETIFLTKDGIDQYNSFLKTIPEKKSLIVKLEYNKDLSLKDYSQLSDDLDLWEEEFEEQFEFLRPNDLFTSVDKLRKSIDEKKIPDGTLKLLGNNFLAFVVIEKEMDSRFSPLIEKIKKKKSNKFNVKLAGIPYTNFLLDQYSRSIKEKVFPLMFAFSFLIILLITRKLFVSIFLFIPCLFSAIISLSFIKFFFSYMNMVTSIVPLMSFTITLATMFHLYFSMIKNKSFVKSFREKQTPILLMIITTCIGFGSLGISPVKAISDFGVLSSILILITSIQAMLWLFLSESYIVNGIDRSLNLQSFERFFHRSFSMTSIIIVGFLSIAIGSYSLSKIKIITDATEYFPVSSGLKKSIDSVNNSVAGLPLYEIIIRNENPESIENLKNIDKLENSLLKKLEDQNNGVYGLLSINSMIKSANKEYSGNFQLPDHLLSYNVLRSKVKESIRESYPLGEYYKITLLGKSINVKEYEENLNVIRTFFKERNKSYEMNGLYYNLMISQKAMIGILLKSFIAALLVVSFISWLYLRRKRAFFIFLFVNVVPVLISLFILFLMNFSLNIATVMTYSIAIGMIVDSSFHIIHSLKKADDIEHSDFLTATVNPIIGSSFLLIACFSLFGFNEFLPIKQFGINLGIILFIGLIFDLFVLPTLFLGHNRVKEVFDGHYL